MAYLWRKFQENIDLTQGIHIGRYNSIVPKQYFNYFSHFSDEFFWITQTTSKIKQWKTQTNISKHKVLWYKWVSKHQIQLDQPSYQEYSKNIERGKEKHHHLS